MTIIIRGTILGFLCLSMIGCAEKKMYVFGDYSQTLYAYEKNHDEASLEAHQQVLEKIITESGKQNTPVPPGINAELGFILIKKNHPQEAVYFFQAEAKQYPESELLMKRLIQMAEKREGSESPPSIPEANQGQSDNEGESIEK